MRNKIRRNITSISCSNRAIKLNRRETKIRFLILPSSPYSTVLKRERIISPLPSLVISLINRVVRLRQRREDERRKTSSITREENTLAGIQRRGRGGGGFLHLCKSPPPRSCLIRAVHSNTRVQFSLGFSPGERIVVSSCLEAIKVFIIR